MTKQETYIRYFETENDALTRCELKNRACKRGPVSSRRYAAGETEVYVKVSGSIGGER